MEEKEINLDNEEEILKVFDFDYCYNSEQCSRELCMFYNDISKQNNNFNKRQAFVDLGIIAITLNQQDKEHQQLKQQVEELKGKRLEFYNDDVRQTQVINGVHFDIEQLLVFSEYVEHEKNISADKDKQINQLKQQLHDLPKKIVEDIRTDFLYGVDGETTGMDIILDSILKRFGGEDE